jgi:prepilin-type N-terminal cleavage/methylation domain-containing protein
MKQRGFTLVELLIVIGIIIILSGVLLPVLIGAGKKADQTKAKAEITTLVNAIKQFESTYGVLPVPSSYTEGDVISVDAYEDLILMLQGEDIANSSWGTTPAPSSEVINPNSRRVRFLDIIGNTPGEYLDPWDQNYKVVFDENYDGRITAADIIPSGYGVNPPGASDELLYFPSPLYFSVAIWSDGPNTDESSAAAIKDNVYSFPVQWSKSDNRYEISR